ncbi:MAG: FliM/FliN family flagellar motor switch protein [bacterium]|nr:FliM/FliN family flagellar motor switch protein [bacterium]
MSSRDDRIRSFDFRRPDKFSKEQLRTLAVLHDHVARRWTSHCSTQLRLPAQVAVTGVEQASYDDFLRRNDDGGMLGLVAMPPLRGEAVVSLDGRLALSLIDRLCGGPGRWEGVPRRLTDIERVALARTIQDLADVLAEGWAGLVEVQPRVEKVEDNPLFVQSMPGSEAGATVQFRADLGAQEGRLELFVPYFTLEPLLPRLNTQAWADRYRQGAAGSGAQVNSRLRRAPVNLTVVLGKTTLPLRRALALRPGVVLRLNSQVEGLLPVLVEGKPVFLGRSGRCGQRLAFRIENLPGGDGEDSG